MKDDEIIAKLIEGQFCANKETEMSGFAILGIITNPTEKMFEPDYSMMKDDEFTFDFGDYDPSDTRERKPLFELLLNMVSEKSFYEFIRDDTKERKLVDVDVLMRPYVAIRDKKA